MALLFETEKMSARAAVGQRSPGKFPVRRSSSSGDIGMDDVTPAAVTPPPERVFFRKYRQERSDRFYVERLFTIREEQHLRQRLCMEESACFARIALSSSFEHRVTGDVESYRAELSFMQAQYDDRTYVSRVKSELIEAIERTERNFGAARALQITLVDHEKTRCAVWDAELAAIADERMSLLRQVGVYAPPQPKGSFDVFLAALASDSRGAVTINTCAPVEPTEPRKRPPSAGESSCEADVVARTDAALGKAQLLISNGRRFYVRRLGDVQ